MPAIVGIALLLINAVVAIGALLLAFWLIKRLAKSRMSNMLAIFLGLVGFALLTSPFVLPQVSYAYRDHLCERYGGWVFTSEANRAEAHAADHGGKTDFPQYKRSATSEERSLWVVEYKLRVTDRLSGQVVAERTDFWSNFTLASGWAWHSRPDSNMCNQKKWADNLAYEHFASRVSDR